MSAKSLALLLETAYDGEELPLRQGEAEKVYEDFERVYKASRSSSGKITEEVHFRFERLRLVVALAFVKAFTRLANNEKSREALDVLLEALKARSTREIDKVVQKKIAVFDQLYHEIFVNEQREHILGLFEQTLDADAKAALDELIFEGLEALQEIDWDAAHDEGDDSDSLDEDLLKNL
jgi:hypothetical protein